MSNEIIVKDIIDNISIYQIKNGSVKKIYTIYHCQKETTVDACSGRRNLWFKIMNPLPVIIFLI